MTANDFTFRAAGLEETDRFGAALAKLLPDGTTVCLSGTLGAGKTRLVQAIAAACGINRADVVSPTFVLCQHYSGTRRINHLDAYRIRDDDEFLELGVDEMFAADGVSLVEWGERVLDCLPKDRVEIQIHVLGDTEREFRLAVVGDVSRRLCEELQLLNSKDVMTSQRISRQQAVPPFFVGVDVGGTNIKIGVVDDQGATLGDTSIRTSEELGAEAAMQRSHDAITGLLSELTLTFADVAAVGLGTPGSMDIAKGLILEPPNMPSWRYFPLRDCLSDLCGKPVGFANDANAAAYGEYWVGSGRQFNSLVMFTLGTGVGGGIILDGVSLDGAHSFGSELGHIIIDSSPDARLCVWGGGQGQLEAYASAPAVVARVADLLAAGRTSSLSKRISQGEELSSLMLSEEAERGDELSREVIVETARLLGVGIVSVVHAVDPEAIILGGAMNFGGHDTATGRMFLARVREEFESRAYHVVRDSVTIDYATLGGDAGYIGAAGIGRTLYQRTKD